MAKATVMATGCTLAKMAVGKSVSNTNVTHTPPPTGILPTFYNETKDTGRKK